MPANGATKATNRSATSVKKWLTFCAVAVRLTVAAAGPQSDKPGSTGEVQTVNGTVFTIESKLSEARTNLALAEATAEAAVTNTPAGISIRDIAARRAMLSRLVRLLEQQLSNIAEMETVKTRRAELARKAQTWTRFAEPPPFSILLADRLREEIKAEQLKQASGEAAISLIDQLIEENRKELIQAEERVRQLNERLETTNDAVLEARLSWQKELDRLRSQVAAATFGVLDSERHFRQEAQEETRIRVAWLQRQLLVAEANTRFTQADLDQIIAGIESERVLIEQEFATTQARLTSTLEAADAARGELRDAQVRKDRDSATLSRLSEALAAREAQLETVQMALRILRFLFEAENTERVMWEMRFAAYDSRQAEALSQSELRLKTFTRRSNLWRDYQQQQMVIMPSQIELQETRVKSLAADSELLPLARERLAALRERDQLLQRLVRRIERVQRLSQRWEEGLRAAEEQLPFLGRVQNLFSDTGSFVQRLWAFELFTAEDTITVDGQRITGRRSITLGKIIMAILILVIGIWVSGFISRIIDPIIIRQLKIEANQANLIRRWVRAFLILCLVMFSLISVKIPLTVFAFAGGALAIGLGFGMQNILKNFVSGLILLFERPFRVGDVLDVAGSRGTVTEIGLRASVLQLWDGTETLIPNSSLLENNVSNWTYSSRKVRFTLSVGAAYGSDTRRVLELLTEAADRHGVVEKDPKPLALFTDFGENALTFELRYWVDVIKANAAQVGSDLRQMIVGAFAENSIVIAYPQRDVHLDTTRPVAVEIVSGQRSEKIDGDGTDKGQQPSIRGEVNG
jgi:potassium-dependent mechanosensitive channel